MIYRRKKDRPRAAVIYNHSPPKYVYHFNEMILEIQAQNRQQIHIEYPEENVI